MGTIVNSDQIRSDDLKSFRFITTPLVAESTRFDGSDIDLIFGFLYLLRKHKTLCIPIKFKVSNEFPIIELGIEWLCINKKRKLIIPKDYKKNFLECKKNKKITFIISLLTLGNKLGCKKKVYSELHANMLIYNKTLDIMYRFEPNGHIVELEDWYDYKDFDNLYSNYIKKELNIKTYKPPQLSSPFLGLQELQENENLGKTLDPGGFCAAWSLFIIDLVLKNPNKDLKILQLMALKKFQKNNKELTNFIRSFSEFIVKQRAEIIGQLPIASQKKLETSASYMEEMPMRDIKLLNQLIVKAFKS